MGYFYHGVSDMVDEDSLSYVINILQSGKLKTRQEVSGERQKAKDGFDHVCLYKKNDEFDYNDPKTIIKSARAGWIEHCFVFIISPDIKARKATSEETDIVDEWRSYGPIPFDKVVGMGIPFDSISEDKERFPKLYDSSFFEKMDFILNYAASMGWRVENSDENEFTEKLDRELDGKLSL